MGLYRIRIERPCFVLIAISFLTIGFAYALFRWGQQDLFWDAAVYYNFGIRIAEFGLFNFADDTRTFGYPLFIAIIWLLSDHTPSTVQLLIFNAQLLIHLSVCSFAFALFNRLFPKIELALCLFAILALNPFLLIYTGVVLSDLLSAAWLFLSLMLAVCPPAQGANRNRIMAGLSFFAAASATMVRPANLTIVVAVAAVWWLRRSIYREGSLRLWLLMAVGFVVPFVPQLINNYRAYAQFQPLIVRSLFSEQLNWGFQYLKYVSVVLPGNEWGIVYSNPFLSPQISSLGEFLIKQPLEFGLTQAIHLFALFDFDYAFPYIRNLDAWYRQPLTLLNYLFLFGVVGGIIAWLARARQPGSFSRLDLALAGFLLGAAVYLPGYILVAVEPRFSLPLYFFLSPFFVYALWRTEMALTQKRWRMIALQAFGLVIFVGANLLVYRWFHTQLLRMPVLDLASITAGVRRQYTLNDIQIRFGDLIILSGVGIDRSLSKHGGEMLYVVLKWLCTGTSIEAYDVQTNLVDAKERVWAERIRDVPDENSLCANGSWGTTEETEVAAFQLPVTMPPGEYAVALRLYDRARGQYVAAYSASGESQGDHPHVATVPIAKNKASITANQLYIENRYFVDMREMRLLGYADLPPQAQAGAEFDLGLYWRARSKPRGDYLIVVHLLDSFGQVVFEQSARPAEGAYPTTDWNEGEVLLDWHSLTVPTELPPGEYALGILLRDAAQGETLGQVRLATITITY
jgi:hypothetical protein